MFELYTEQARRVLFFARFEASQHGSVRIETEHLLLGLLREGKGLTGRIFERHAPVEDLRQAVTATLERGQPISTAIEIPFSPDARRALEFAAQEAKRLLHQDISMEHLLLGILRTERSAAATILTERGLGIDTVREEVVQLRNEVVGHDRVPHTVQTYREPSRHSEGRLPDFVASDVVHIMHSGRQGHPSIRTSNTEWCVVGFTLKRVLAELWHVDETRVEAPAAFDNDTYDVVVKLPGPEPRETIERLVRHGIERQLNLTVAHEGRRRDVYVLTAPAGAGPALRFDGAMEGGVGAGSVAWSSVGSGGYEDEAMIFPLSEVKADGMPMQMLCTMLEQVLGRPLIDETGLTGTYRLDLRNSVPNRDAFIEALRSEAGLMVTPASRNVQMVVARAAGGESG